MHIAIDTNAFCTANKNPAAEPGLINCIHACIKLLDQVETGEHVLVLDEQNILREYRQQPELAQPGRGQLMLFWIYQHLYEPGVCEVVEITRENGSFAEFPADEEARKFDNDDHKFVAVALKYEQEHQMKVTIYNATDADWAQHYASLAKYVQIEFLCPDIVPHP